MKMILAITLLASISVQAQKNLSSAQVPAASKEAFANAHPNVTGKWEKEGKDYEVTFKEGGKTMSCVIEKSGTIKETETEIPVSDLPVAVTNAIAENFKAVKVKDAATIVRADGTTVYEAVIKGKDVLFDASGNIVKKYR